MTRSAWRATALLTAAFIVGGIAGAAVVATAERGERAGVEKHRHEHRSRRGGHLEMLAKELELSPTQRDSVRAILDRSRPSMDSIWKDVAPRFETLQERIRSDIRSQLNPDQTSEYDNMIRRLEEDRRDRKSRK